MTARKATPDDGAAILTTTDVRTRYGITRTRVHQLMKERGVGRKLSDGRWIFTEAEVEALRPGPVGRPGKVAQP